MRCRRNIAVESLSDFIQNVTFSLCDLLATLLRCRSWVALRHSIWRCRRDFHFLLGTPAMVVLSYWTNRTLYFHVFIMRIQSIWPHFEIPPKNKKFQFSHPSVNLTFNFKSILLLLRDELAQIWEDICDAKSSQLSNATDLISKFQLELELWPKTWPKR